MTLRKTRPLVREDRDFVRRLRPFLDFSTLAPLLRSQLARRRGYMKQRRNAGAVVTRAGPRKTAATARAVIITMSLLSDGAATAA